MQEYLEIYKVENLITWLSERDPNEEYNYESCRECLLAQYLRYNIPEFVSIGIDWWDKKGNVYEIPNFKALNQIALGQEKKEGWTFGKALERARTYMGNEKRQADSCMRYGNFAYH